MENNSKKSKFWTIQTIASIVAMAAIVICSISAIMYHDAFISANSRLEKSMKENAELKTKLENSVAEIESLKKKSKSAEGKSNISNAQLVCGGPGTIARRFNNPCNVKAPINGGKWKGQLGMDKERHVHFKSIFHGIRAAAITLRSYYTRHNIKTIRGIIDRYCGGHSGYVKFLCEEMHLKPDQEFNIINRIPELVWLMSQYESSRRLPEDYVVTLDVIR